MRPSNLWRLKNLFAIQLLHNPQHSAAFMKYNLFRELLCSASLARTSLFPGRKINVLWLHRIATILSHRIVSSLQHKLKCHEFIFYSKVCHVSYAHNVCWILDVRECTLLLLNVKFGRRFHVLQPQSPFTVLCSQMRQNNWRKNGAQVLLCSMGITCEKFICSIYVWNASSSA